MFPSLYGIDFLKNIKYLPFSEVSAWFHKPWLRKKSESYIAIGIEIMAMEEWSSFHELMLCLEPTVVEGLRFSINLIIINVVIRIVINYVRKPEIIDHVISFILGIFLLYSNVDWFIIWTLGLSFFSYLIILCLHSYRFKGVILSAIIFFFLLTCESIIVNHKMWQQIRGIQMIAAMKIISFVIDFDRGLHNSLNIFEFMGYIFCPANCLLGPWISFNNYKISLKRMTIGFNWFKTIFTNLILSMIFLVFSNCLVPLYAIDDDSNKWLIAYRDAQGFRMSHYFVSYLSLVSMASAGFGLNKDGDLMSVTKPFFIEMPRSLVQVVVYWNIPMHQWLKNYVFKSTLHLGNFTAISFTYLISSILHGFNLQLSSVLLSIGIFSYVEYNFRLKISSVFNSCSLSNKCVKQCSHKYNKTSPFTVALNFIFSFLTIVQLAYLGVMFEASYSLQETGYSFQHTLSKWDNLNYLCHYITVFIFSITSII